MTAAFSAGAVLTAANLNSAINTVTANAITSAGYTLVLGDAGKLVTLSNASAQNLTVPLNASVAYATGTVIELLNVGAGTWTVTPTGGVTVNGQTAIATNGRIRLTKTGTDTWYSSTFGGGKVLQAVTASLTTTFSATSTTFTNITGLTASITPSSTSSKVLVLCTIGMVDASTADFVNLKIQRGGVDTVIATSVGAGQIAALSNHTPAAANRPSTVVMSFLDSPSSTSSLAYQAMLQSPASTAYINRTSSDTASSAFSRTASTITLLEIGA